MLRSLKSKRRSSRPRSRNGHGGTCTRAPSCWNRQRNKCVCNFFYFPRVSDIFWSKAILRRNVHEGVIGCPPARLSFTVEQINPLQAAAASKNKSKDIHLPSIDVSFGSNRILYGRRHHCIILRLSSPAAPEHRLHLRTGGVMVSSVAMVSENRLSFGTLPCARFLSLHISPSSSSSKRYNPISRLCLPEILS